MATMTRWVHETTGEELKTASAKLEDEVAAIRKRIETEPKFAPPAWYRSWTGFRKVGTCEAPAAAPAK